MAMTSNQVIITFSKPSHIQAPTHEDTYGQKGLLSGYEYLHKIMYQQPDLIDSI